jgi:phospholipase/carboxylesterase
MVISRREFLAAAAALQPGLVPRSSGSIQPSEGGTYPLGFDTHRDGLVYVPGGYRDGTPAKLMLLFHGAGGSASRSAAWFPLADAFGVVVLAPDSRDERSWDAVLGDWGPDVEFVARALRQTVDRWSIDRKRMCVAGFSDGASYSLSFGIGAGDVFSHVAAFSPGFMTPRDARGTPRIFISHGTGDAVMPIDETSRRFVPALRKLGYDVTFREYEGGHSVPEPVVREAFAWFVE